MSGGNSAMHCDEHAIYRCGKCFDILGNPKTQQETATMRTNKEVLGEDEISLIEDMHDNPAFWAGKYLAMESKLAAAEEDAARYRWLRDNGNITWSLDFEEMIVSFEVDPDITDADAAGLDAAIDAARSEV